MQSFIFEILKLIIRWTRQNIENKFQFKNLSETSDSGFATNDQYYEPAKPENMRQHGTDPFQRRYIRRAPAPQYRNFFSCSVNVIYIE